MSITQAAIPDRALPCNPAASSQRSDVDTAARLAALETEILEIHERLGRLLGNCPVKSPASQSENNLALRWWGGRWT